MEQQTLLSPVVHEEECMVASLCRARGSRLDPDMLPQAILQACSPLPCVHFARAPPHTTLPLLLIPLPLPTVSIAAAVAHHALPMLQIILPSSCELWRGRLWAGGMSVVMHALPYLSLQCRRVEAAQGRRNSWHEQVLQRVITYVVKLACVHDEDQLSLPY